MQEVALAMLLDSDSEPDSKDDLDSESEGNSDSNYYDLLGALALARDAISSSRYLDRGAGGSDLRWGRKFLFLSKDFLRN